MTHACPPMECHSGGQVWRRLCPAKPFLTASFTGEAKMAPTDPGWVDGNISLQEGAAWASLVAQWLRICLLMQGTRVRALVREDPTCRRATRPVSHNY